VHEYTVHPHREKADTHTHRNPLWCHSIKTPSLPEKPTPAFTRSCSPTPINTKRQIDKKKMCSSGACKIMYLAGVFSPFFLLCGAQEQGVISIHFHPWHPADNPSPFPDYVR